MDHFSELQQLLRAGHYENDGRQHHVTRSTRVQPTQMDWAAGPSSSSRNTSSRPLHHHPSGTTGPVTRSRRLPPPAPGPIAPLLLRPAPALATRPPASQNDVNQYLAHRHHRPAPDHQQPAPEQHRRSKRGKPLARRSLQALFDAAAEDSSTWQTSGDCTEEDGEVIFGGSATSQEKTSSGNGLFLVKNFNQKYASSSPQGMLLRSDVGLGPSTPATCEPGLHGAATIAAVVPPPRSSSSSLEIPTPSTAAAVPLNHLLLSERGRRLTCLEVKAIILRVAEDLAALHAANVVHRHVSIDSISLACCSSSDAVAVATLPPSRSIALLGASRCYWALRESGTDAQCAPEVSRCPADRLAAFTPAGDMWSVGVLLFSLLSGGALPFGEAGVCEEGDACSVDALQRRLHRQLRCEIDVVNQLSLAQGGDDDSDEEMEMRVIGFDADAKALLLSLLRADPAQRLLAEEVLTHSWVAEAAPLVPRLPVLPPANSHLSFQHQEQMKCSVSAPTTTSKRERSPPPPPTLGNGIGIGIGGHLLRSDRRRLVNASTNTISGGSGVNTTLFTNNHFQPQPQQQFQHHQFPLFTSSSSTALHGMNALPNLPPLPPPPPPPPAAAPPAECPYPVIGHVAQPVQVLVDGRSVTISALHAVYDVPGHGAMMSAAPVAVADSAQVSAATATHHHGNNSNGGGFHKL